MYKFILTLLISACLNICLAQNAHFIKPDSACFITGTQDNYKDIDFNDHAWKMQKLGDVWQSQGYPDYHGYAWYRIHVRIPSSLKKNAIWADSLRVYLAHVNDVDETYFNGVKLGKIGSFPEDKGGYVSKWPAVRSYCIPANSTLIKWDEDNVIAVKVYDGGGTGGIFMGEPFIDMLEKTDGIEFTAQAINFLPGDKAQRKLLLQNKFNTTITGTFHYKIIDAAQHITIKEANVATVLSPFATKEFTLDFPHREGIELTYDYTEKNLGQGQKLYRGCALYINACCTK